MKSVAGRPVNEKPSSRQAIKCRTVAKGLYKFAYVFKSSLDRNPTIGKPALRGLPDGWHGGRWRKTCPCGHLKSHTIEFLGGT
jgi:hypothetical protein